MKQVALQNPFGLCSVCYSEYLHNPEKMLETNNQPPTTPMFETTSFKIKSWVIGIIVIFGLLYVVIGSLSSDNGPVVDCSHYDCESEHKENSYYQNIVR